jgi:hypothetical protein
MSTTPSLASIDAKLTQLLTLGGKMSATIQQVLANQATEKADLALLVTAQQNLLNAVATGIVSPAQLQTVLTEMQAEDASIKTMTAAATAAAPASSTTASAAP